MEAATYWKAPIRDALGKVRRAAEKADQSPDLEATLEALNAARDAINSAAATIGQAMAETRAEAWKRHIEKTLENVT